MPRQALRRYVANSNTSTRQRVIRAAGGLIVGRTQRLKWQSSETPHQCSLFFLRVGERLAGIGHHHVEYVQPGISDSAAHVFRPAIQLGHDRVASFRLRSLGHMTLRARMVDGGVGIDQRLRLHSHTHPCRHFNTGWQLPRAFARSWCGTP